MNNRMKWALTKKNKFNVISYRLLIHDQREQAGKEEEEELVEYYNWWFICVLVFVVAGTVGNVLVCLAVSLERPLQNVTNWFLVSLAFADLLVSTIVMPFGAAAGFLGTHKPTLDIQYIAYFDTLPSFFDMELSLSLPLHLSILVSKNNILYYRMDTIFQSD